MDPFRDELGAAHAKIARLEEHVQHLEGRRPPPPAKRLPHSMIVYILFSILLFVVLGAVTIVAFRALVTSGAAHRQSHVDDHQLVAGVECPELNEQVHIAHTVGHRVARWLAR